MLRHFSKYLKKEFIYLPKRNKNTENKKSSMFQTYQCSELENDKSYVSTYHLESMLKFFVHKKPLDETKYEKEYRLKHEEIQLWNHHYWLENNENFFKGKEKIKNNLQETNESQEQLSTFYKNFLDSNYKKHVNYNMEWYKKNLELLLPALKANLSRLYINLSSKTSKIEK